ncbi:uncharacterized protein TM35_000073050 [Trypanosoma theileri]|uniref:Uncharacterized protein n=1 Tax=Trypanosoma theileri TaxID=67003 RepID=A0A1X0P205_9TRYP|nr:uncharacterized protein TM35_000073050 [Trypanosoma theileri]ORC90881.1 hypothetical protein TM35_000073050 [Trypanosoma theileri]
MEDALILNFIRLVRNGRRCVMAHEVFRWGDLHMMDNGAYEKDEEDLRKHRCKKGLPSPVYLVVSVKGSVAEVWKFQDFRSTTTKTIINSTLTPSSIAFQGVMLNEQYEASLKTLVSVIYAYLRIHELYLDIMDTDPDDVSLQLVLENEELPKLELDSCTKQVWAVEGLLGVNVTYNRLWRTFMKNKAVPVNISNETHSTAVNVKTDYLVEPHVGSTAAQGSDSMGSGRSLPTPHFAPAPLPSSMGSGQMGISQKFFRSPPFAIPEIFLPHAATNINDSHSFFTSPSLGAAAAAVAGHGTRTPAVRGYSFVSVPTFAALGSDSQSGDENDMISVDDQLHELLEICDTVHIQESFVELSDVLNILDKKLLIP